MKSIVTDSQLSDRGGNRTVPGNITSVHLFRFILLIAFFQICTGIRAEDGYRLWLRYETITDTRLVQQYRKSLQGWMVEGESPTLSAARNELQAGLNGLFGHGMLPVRDTEKSGILIAGTSKNSGVIASLGIADRLARIGHEGYLIYQTTLENKKMIIIAANEDIGVLYGVFHFLRLLQTHQDISRLSVESSPKTRIRLLNHWDNLDRTVERGYAGFSLWDWQKLPDYLSPQYIDYARANASIGLNGTVLTNVNANALILTKEYLVKVAALAGVFRPYGIKVYLTARFNAPMETGSLKTADPLDAEVIDWWRKKADEIYRYIPDFGGFLVKANSEGQPGPQNFGRTHADGANMLADALAPHGGIVMWRAFVYDNNEPVDRAMQAYIEFTPLDGKFRENVLIQVKNGPIDFQPREPFHPLFGAMPFTPLMVEFQITQEYLGFATHLVYLAPLFEECLSLDTYARGEGSAVAKIVDGTLENQELTGMAGVSNIGTDRNWTGHHFAQANWYAFGRLAWDPYLKSGEIAAEWLRMTFTNDDKFVAAVSKIMLASRETAVNYMTPLGLHHQMGKGHHYGPGPWVNTGRADWTSVYYHKADSGGIGFDRTSAGSNAVGQYFPPVRNYFGNINSCPENLLLWFHHVSWDYRLASGNTLWEELCFYYSAGVDSVRWMMKEWQEMQGTIDKERFEQVKAFLMIQEKEAKWWRDASILYFQTFSGKPLPGSLEKPEHSLQYYKDIRLNFIPGI